MLLWVKVTLLGYMFSTTLKKIFIWILTASGKNRIPEGEKMGKRRKKAGYRTMKTGHWGSLYRLLAFKFANKTWVKGILCSPR